MEKLSWNTIIFIIICLVAFYTNPNERKHENAVREILAEEMNNSFSGNDINKTDMILLRMGNSELAKLIDGFITRDNLFLFSLTKINMSGNTATIGFGIFGNVFVFDEIKSSFKDGIEAYYKNYKNNNESKNNEAY